MSRRFWVSLTMSSLLPVAAGACTAHPATTALHDRHCIAEFRPGTDYFPP
jgi:hypothetical protein